VLPKKRKGCISKIWKKSKKKVQKEIESLETKISKANSEINDADRDIPRN
jgi:peptidoglycan hydrolase CwlO-like protein